MTRDRKAEAALGFDAHNDGVRRAANDAAMWVSVGEYALRRGGVRIPFCREDACNKEAVDRGRCELHLAAYHSAHGVAYRLRRKAKT